MRPSLYGRAGIRSRSEVVVHIGANEEEVEIRWVRTAAEVEGALGLRERVFCGEQGVSPTEERDALDERARHLIAIDTRRRVVGSLRLLGTREVAKIGRVAVEREWRRRGIAARMLDAALTLASDRGCQEARLASQLEAVGLYERESHSLPEDLPRLRFFTTR